MLRRVPKEIWIVIWRDFFRTLFRIAIPIKDRLVLPGQQHPNKIYGFLTLLTIFTDGRKTDL